jgi:hypothetical protein
MAGIFKTFLGNDSVATRTLLHESVPLTGSVVSGATDANIKEYSHEMFVSVYDSDYTAASANQWFDMTVGIKSGSAWLEAEDDQFTKKQVIYSQLASVLMGHDRTGSINEFDQDGDLAAGGTKYQEVLAIPFSRVLVKDEIKRGSFSAEFGSGDHDDPFATTIKLIDNVNNYRVNSPAGEYGILTVSGSATQAGLLFYQAGVAIIDLSGTFGSYEFNSGADTFEDMSGSTIEEFCESVRHRMYNIQFNNTLELDSTIYFCRLNHNDFNYSSNPTYLSGSKIRVKENANDLSSTYITGVGLYGADSSLLAVAKLSTPIIKNKSTEAILKVRLDH